VLDSSSVQTVYLHGDAITQPYWLTLPRVGDLFAAASDSVSDDERQQDSWVIVPIILPGRTKPILVRTPAVYHFADPVRGDVQRPVVTAPGISVTFSRNVEIARANVQFERLFEVTLRSSYSTAHTVNVQLQLPPGLRIDSVERKVVLAPGATRTVVFKVRGTVSAGTHTIEAIVSEGDNLFVTGFVPIEYDHIAPQRMYSLAQVRLDGINVALRPKLNVGYVPGVGDNVAPMLRDLGIPITMIDPSALPGMNLSSLTTIVVGTRAYQSSQTLIDNNGYLLDYVRKGGNLVVQYGQNEMTRPGMLPYPITLTSPAARVTEEDAPVTILDAKSLMLTTPNAITQEDFAAWVQERATYMPSTFDERYATVLEMHDPGEQPNQSALLSTTYGQGTYTYVTLALFRQLPAAVAGGVRIFANLLR
jgi:hypothetical protein